MSDLGSEMREMMDNVIEAEREIGYVYNMAAELLVGQMKAKNIDFDTLCELKSELKGFDAKQGKWKQ